MRRPMTFAGTVLGLAAGVAFLASARHHTEPICDQCPAAHVTAEEIQQFLDYGLLDQQIRGIDDGRNNIHLALVHRGRLTEPGSVAEHSHVTEIYYITSGSGYHRTGHAMIDERARGDQDYVVRLLNGPGHSASGLREFEEQYLKTGDVLMIPGGTGHQFVRIDDHITYVMVRVDPNRHVAPMTEGDARAYLRGEGPWGRPRQSGQ
jgi:mannose-6-phosphate isomerase-like protein (cupin superfamily)